MSFLQRLRDLDAKATPPVWSVGRTSMTREALLRIGPTDGFAFRSLQMGEADAAFIAFARNSAPRLAALVGAVGAYIEALKGLHSMSLSSSMAAQLRESHAKEVMMAAYFALDTEPT